MLLKQATYNNENLHQFFICTEIELLHSYRTITKLEYQVLLRHFKRQIWRIKTMDGNRYKTILEHKISGAKDDLKLKNNDFVWFVNDCGHQRVKLLEMILTLLHFMEIIINSVQILYIKK